MVMSLILIFGISFPSSFVAHREKSHVTETNGLGDQQSTRYCADLRRSR